MTMKRQFVWIMSDSTRYDMIGCYGNPVGVGFNGGGNCGCVQYT